jgi:DNA-directed RNA polymerase subunit RPC12/RpoP
MGYKIVCIRCYLTFNRDLDDDVNRVHTCPKCGERMDVVSQSFMPPGKMNVKKWDTVSYLLSKGFLSVHNEHGVPADFYKRYPENFADVQKLVQQYTTRAGEVTNDNPQ